MNNELTKRLKALCWHMGMMLVAMALDFGAQNAGLLNLSTEQTVMLGLFLAQISKAIHNYIAENTQQPV